jgi:TRAP-type mannitol/chloroaromatic compound transport system substrate-binding protein
VVVDAVAAGSVVRIVIKSLLAAALVAKMASEAVKVMVSVLGCSSWTKNVKVSVPAAVDFRDDVPMVTGPRAKVSVALYFGTGTVAAMLSITVVPSVAYDSVLML